MPGFIWIFIIIFVIIGIFSTYNTFKGKNNDEFSEYTEDMIKNAKWRWEWNRNEVSNLWCFCPQCDATLVYNDSSCTDFYTDKNNTLFICENCNNKIVSDIDGGNKSYALGFVRREIDRRIRTGEYKV